VNRCVGERSSRRIEKKLVEDVGFRVVAANQHPDHATLARFRVDHQNAITGLFAQVLRLCQKTGLLDSGVVAVDGTKMAGNASREASFTAGELAERVDEASGFGCY
jgi:transposase